jgi:hypothetical protein
MAPAVAAAPGSIHLAPEMVAQEGMVLLG